MLVFDSLPILWMQYLAVSLIVLVTGWFGTRWLPKALQGTLVGMVAGLCWMPWGFYETATATDDSFGGVAPAIIIAAVDVLRHRMGSALLVTVLAAGIGAAVGWLFGSWYASRSMLKRRHASSSGERPTSSSRYERREPTL